MSGLLKASELREKTPDELMKILSEYKVELASLRVAKVTGGAASKLCRIKVMRQAIARVLTVFNQKRKAEAVAKWSGSAILPKCMRPRLTHKLRRKMTAAQIALKPGKAVKRAINFRQKLFVVEA
jgi:large subunit ribosomal protein L35e